MEERPIRLEFLSERRLAAGLMLTFSGLLVALHVGLKDHVLWRTLDDAILASTVTSLFWLTVIPALEKRALRRPRVLPRGVINLVMSRAARRSSHWAYRGNAAQYVREHVLPTFAKRGGSVELCLMNPSADSTAWGHYDHYFREFEKAELDPDQAKIEVYATLVSVLVQFAEAPVKLSGLTIHVTDVVSHVRMDITDEMALLTYPPGHPALYVPKNDPLYAALRTEYRLLADQARALKIPARVPRQTELNDEAVAWLLGELFDGRVDLSADEIRRVREEALS